MQSSLVGRSAAMLLWFLSSVSFAQTTEHAPVSMPSANLLAQDKPSSESWTYVSPDFRSSHFSSVCVPAAKIYAGSDAQFPSTSPEDKQRFANMLTGALTRELSRSFALANQDQHDCLVIQLTLVGLQNTDGAMATVSRIGLLGFAVSTVKSLEGKRGANTGSMLVALEMSEGKTGGLLVAAVRRRYPDALDAEASLSTSKTMRAVADGVAREIRDRLVGDKVVAINAR